MAMIGCAYAFGVKRACKIQRVKNRINVIMLAAGCMVAYAVDHYLDLLQHNIVYLLPFLGVYVITYWLYNLPETKTEELNIKNHRVTTDARIFYKDIDGVQCEAVQSWKAVLARWFRGDRTIMQANGTLFQDWEWEDKEVNDTFPLLMINSESR